MATVLVTLRILPESVEVQLNEIEEHVKKEVADFGGQVAKVEEEPIAFGLVALKIIFSMDESKGATDALEEKISQQEGIRSVEVVDVRRAFG